MQATVGVRLSGGYYFHTLTRLIGDLQPLLHLEEQARVDVDLTDLTFIGPTGLSLFLATLSRASDRRLWGPGSAITPPRSKPLSTHLERIDLMRMLFEDPADLGASGRRKQTGLRECEHFVDACDGAAVAKTVADTVTAEVATETDLRAGVYMCLSELTDNVLYHGDTPLGGFVAGQSFGHTNEIEVGIVDLGMGIAASLSSNEQFAPVARDDLTAIKTAMKPTVTSTPARDNGYGLTFTRFLLALNHGRLAVCSGVGHAHYGEKTVEKTEQHGLPGTLVALRLRTDRPFDTSDAWGLLWKAVDAVADSGLDAAHEPIELQWPRFA